jgi:hypothetical protein
MSVTKRNILDRLRWLHRRTGDLARSLAQTPRVVPDEALDDALERAEELLRGLATLVGVLNVPIRSTFPTRRPRRP